MIQKIQGNSKVLSRTRLFLFSIFSFLLGQNADFFQIKTFPGFWGALALLLFVNSIQLSNSFLFVPCKRLVKKSSFFNSLTIINQKCKGSLENTTENFDMEEGTEIKRRTRRVTSAERLSEEEDETITDFEDGPKIPHDSSAVYEAYIRGRWLLLLMVLQSSSSFVLDKYQDLIQKHIVVTLFLTMLVGAGGNAGNQSAIKVIQGFSKGVLKADGPSFRSVIIQQAQVGVMIGVALAAGGFVRVFLAQGDVLGAVAISLSLLVIVVSSVLIGASLPFGLAKIGVDPANAGTTIQVVMDVLGVATTCTICSLILNSVS